MHTKLPPSFNRCGREGGREGGGGMGVELMPLWLDNAAFVCALLFQLACESKTSTHNVHVCTCIHTYTHTKQTNKKSHSSHVSSEHATHCEVHKLSLHRASPHRCCHYQQRKWLGSVPLSSFFFVLLFTATCFVIISIIIIGHYSFRFTSVFL
jgi:hypothetical protein